MNKHNIIAGILILVVGLTIGTWYGSNYGFSLPFRDKALQSSAALAGPGTWSSYCRTHGLGPYIGIYMTQTNVLVYCRDGNVTVSQSTGKSEPN